MSLCNTEYVAKRTKCSCVLQKLTAGAEDLLFVNAASLQILLKNSELSSEHVLYSMLDKKLGEVLEQKFQLKQSGLYARMAARVNISEIQGYVSEATGTFHTSLPMIHEPDFCPIVTHQHAHALVGVAACTCIILPKVPKN